MDHIDSRTSALRAFADAWTRAQTAHAAAVLDALDRHAEQLTDSDRHDAALASWAQFTDTDYRLPTSDIVTVLLRVARYLDEETVVRLMAEQFEGEEIRHRLAGGAGLIWMPEDDVVILSYPVGAILCDVVLSRRKTRAS